VCNIFIAGEPLAGKRIASVTSQRTKQDWAKFLETIERQYHYAEKIILVMDNLNTHKLGSFYETFESKKARALLDRFEFVYTPKHGSIVSLL
jgi:hypothetical protein